MEINIILAPGDCTIFKLSSEASLSILEIAKIIKDIFLKGIFNIITGKESESDQYLFSSSKLSKLTFTRNTEVLPKIDDLSKKICDVLWMFKIR